jgi:hypothetical protein
MYQVICHSWHIWWCTAVRVCVEPYLHGFIIAELPAAIDRAWFVLVDSCLRCFPSSIKPPAGWPSPK